jgi:group I intron endonuclease
MLYMTNETQYKQTGVYKITNKLNGNFYIGSSLDIKSRWDAHIKSIHRGFNYPIYNAFKKYGVENFNLEILELCNTDKLVETEQKFLDQWVGSSKCYNIAKFADAPMRGRTHTQDAILKMSKNRKLATTEETRKKIGSSWRGKKQPIEMIEKRVKSLRGKKRSDDQRRLLSDAATHRYDIGGKPYPTLIHDDGSEIPAGRNIRRMCKHTGLNLSGIFRLIHGSVDTYKGWRIK